MPVASQKCHCARLSRKRRVSRRYSGKNHASPGFTIKKLTETVNQLSY